MRENMPVDVAAAIESQRMNSFVARVVGLSLLVALFDGLDQALISFAAPTIAPAFNLSPPMIGNMFSAGLVGSMLGGFLFGWLSDRIGRRPAMIFATLIFSVFTLATALATSYPILLVVRFAVGIGTGGLLPVCWSMNVETVPKRFRSTIVTIVMLGYSAGASLGGPVSVWLIPAKGWQSVFIFSGLLSLAATGILVAFQPESLRFHAAHRRGADKIARALRHVAPRMAFAANAHFILSDEPVVRNAKPSPSQLFQGRLRWITPLFWVAYILSSIATFFLSFWTPLVFQALHYPASEAAAAGSITAIAGALGGLALMRFTDSRGVLAVAAMPALAVPLLIIASRINLPDTAFLALIGLIAFALIGGHIGMNSISGIFYPSALRGTGSGWSTAVGKIGSIAGPILGGALLATNMPTLDIFAFMAICPALLLICLVVLARLHPGAAAADRAVATI